MNMKKALAAGVAATLAVTSLSAIVSADTTTGGTIQSILDTTGNTRTFNMQKTFGSYKLKGSAAFTTYKDGLSLGQRFSLTDDEWSGTNGVARRRLVAGVANADQQAAIDAANTAITEANNNVTYWQGLYDASNTTLTGEAAGLGEGDATGYTYEQAVKKAATILADAEKEVTLRKNLLEIAQTAFSDGYVAAKAADDADEEANKDLPEGNAQEDAGDAAVDAGDIDYDYTSRVEKLQKAVEYATKKYSDALTAKATAEDSVKKLAEDAEDNPYADILAKREYYKDQLAAAKKAAQTAADNLAAARAAVEFKNKYTATTQSVTQYADKLDIEVPKTLARGGAPNLSFVVEGVFGTRTAIRGETPYAIKYTGETSTAYTYTFYIYGEVAPVGGFQPASYLEITKVKLVADGKEVSGVYDRTVGNSTVTVKTSGLTENQYNVIGKEGTLTAAEQELVTGLGLTDSKGYTESGSISITRHFDNASAGVRAATKVTANNTNENNLLDQFELLIGDVSGTRYSLVDGSKKIDNIYAFLPRTVAENATLMGRNSVDLLSKTGAYYSESWTLDEFATAGYDDWNSGDGQTYNDDNLLGSMPNYFAGLASQVADFFNKYYQGTITFTLGSVAAGSGSSDWVTGGVPSSEAGIKLLLQNMSANNVALFFNYGSTTGSLQAATTVDATNGKIVFDISEVLDALDGRTIGTIQDIYYGLNKSNATFGGWNGLWVTEVSLERKDASDVAAETEDATDEVETDAADVADDVEDEVPEVIEADDEDTDDTDADDEDIAADDEDVAADDEDVAAEDEDDYAEDEDDFADDEADTADDVDEPADVDDDVADDITADDADDTYVEPADDETATIDDTVAPAADDVAGENVTPTITPAVEADENPGTGVALAVVPAVLAAAAIVISKKRK